MFRPCATVDKTFCEKYTIISIFWRFYMAKKSKSKKMVTVYLAAILFSALVIGMAFLPVFTYETPLSTTNINGFQLMKGSFSDEVSGDVVGIVSFLLGETDNVKVASIFILVAIACAGLSVLFALACLLTGKNFRMVQFLLLAFCFVACLVAMIMLFVVGDDVRIDIGNLSKGIVNVGAYLMTVFSLIGACCCNEIKK